MDELVELLTRPQRVEVTGRPQATVADFKERLEMKYVLLKFTETGTELGVKLDPSATHAESADFERGAGTVTLRGTLNLNYTDVALAATIDLTTLSGTGQLEPVA